MTTPDYALDSLLDEARDVGLLGPLAAPGHVRRAAPFLAIGGIDLATIALDDPSRVLATVLLAAGSIGAMAASAFVPWRRMPRWCQPTIAVGSLLLVDALMRTHGGPGSHFLLVLLLPLVWLALYESRAWLGAGLVVSGGLLALEMVPLPPREVSLRVFVLLAGAVAVLPSLRALVDQNRWALATGEKQSRELRHLALHDPLTGLANRTLVMDRLEQLLARVRRDGGQAAALFIDLDGFKDVNDAYGHESGDQLLQAVASRLTSALREVDTIGRLGGDEFVVVVDCTDTPSAPELVAQRVLDVIRQPFQVADGAQPLMVTASVGVASSSTASANQLLRNADVALYRAKRAAHNCYVLFQAEAISEPTTGEALPVELEDAISDHQFHLLYQPIYDLDQLGMVGVEALVRWRHPTRGDLPPDEFIPALEGSGQIVEVGRWVLQEACTQMARWRRSGRELSVSVNVSARQLDHDDVIDHVRDALRISGLPAAALTLEVTETAILRDLDAVSSRLRQLKFLGVQIALDDFGTGYSSLAYLQHFPIDTLKIDRSFIEAVGHCRDSDAIIRTLVQLGKDLGLSIVAEGVENTEQLDQVRKHGISNVQGFLLSRPLDPTTFESHLLRIAADPPSTSPRDVDAASGVDALRRGTPEPTAAANAT